MARKSEGPGRKLKIDGAVSQIGAVSRIQKTMKVMSKRAVAEGWQEYHVERRLAELHDECVYWTCRLWDAPGDDYVEWRLREALQARRRFVRLHEGPVEPACFDPYAGRDDSYPPDPNPAPRPELPPLTYRLALSLRLA